MTMLQTQSTNFKHQPQSLNHKSFYDFVTSSEDLPIALQESPSKLCRINMRNKRRYPSLYLWISFTILSRYLLIFVTWDHLCLLGVYSIFVSIHFSFIFRGAPVLVKYVHISSSGTHPIVYGFTGQSSCYNTRLLSHSTTSVVSVLSTTPSHVVVCCGVRKRTPRYEKGYVRQRVFSNCYHS